MRFRSPEQTRTRKHARRRGRAESRERRDSKAVRGCGFGELSQTTSEGERRRGVARARREREVAWV